MPLPDLSGLDRDLVRRDIERANCEESLYDFFKTAWKYIDPSIWKDGWPIDAVCEHLQAVCDGDIRRLIINIPPRCSKSSLCAVAFPAWVWAQTFRGPTSGPIVPFLYASYNDKLSLRDSVKCRRLIESPWYQQLWGDRFRISSDQNTKSRFSNDQGGERLITSIGSGVTGEGGNIIVIDDPNAANEAFSEATIQSTIDWWDQTMPTRLNDMQTGAYIIIQQRLAEDDLTGHILEKNVGDWTHLCLPMRYEKDRTTVTVIGWSDPRKEEGDLLWPERFTDESVKILEQSMGKFIAAGQLQQRPEPQGGGIIKREWWQVWDIEEGAKFPPMDFTMACLDTAYTEDTMNDPSGMIVWGIFSEVIAQTTRKADKKGNLVYADRQYSNVAPKLMMMHAWDKYLEFHELVTEVAKTCKDFKVDMLMIENKSAGISVAQEIRRLYSDEKFSVQLFDPKSQDKTARLYSVQHIFQEGLVYCPERPWAERVIVQVGQHPRGKHDEYVDLTSMGLRKLREMGLLVRAPERQAELDAQRVYPGASKSAPLYGGI